LLKRGLAAADENEDTILKAWAEMAAMAAMGPKQFEHVWKSKKQTGGGAEEKLQPRICTTSVSQPKKNSWKLHCPLSRAVRLSHHILETGQNGPNPKNQCHC